MFVFFFKQKTAYEMRISDWSSDVCSSDLRGRRARRHHPWLRALRAKSRRAFRKKPAPELMCSRATQGVAACPQALLRTPFHKGAYRCPPRHFVDSRSDRRVLACGPVPETVDHDPFRDGSSTTLDRYPQGRAKFLYPRFPPHCHSSTYHNAEQKPQEV